MSKTATTWQLMKSSWRVLMRDKVLLVFPVISSIACFLVLLTFALPLLGVEAAKALGIFRGGIEVFGYLLLFFFYLGNFFVITFCNGALVHFVVTRAQGGEPTVGGSLRAMMERLPQILAWSSLSATIGVVFKVVESRGGDPGSLVAGIAGIAWALVSYFVVPFIVIERKGTLEAVAASKDLLGRTWGKQILSGLGYGLIGFLLTAPAQLVILFAIIGAIVTWGAHWAIWAAIALSALFYMFMVAIALSALDAIFGAALYLFARTGSPPEGFTTAELQAAVRPA